MAILREGEVFMIHKDIKNLRRPELVEIIYQLKKNKQELENRLKHESQRWIH